MFALLIQEKLKMKMVIVIVQKGKLKIKRVIVLQKLVLVIQFQILKLYPQAGQEKKEALLVAQEIIGKKRVMVLEERRNMMV